MSQKAHPLSWGWACGAYLICTLLAGPPLHAQSQIERPRIADISSDHGPLQPLQPITLTVHLNFRSQAAFDKAVEDLYTPGSPTYHHWMTNSEIASYAPSATDVETVKEALESHGLSVLSVSSDRLSIRVRGTATDVESAFQTQIHEFEREGRVFHANVTPARLAGSAGSLVHGVTGLTSFIMKPFIQFQIDPRTGKPLTASRFHTNLASGTGGFASFATNNCFSSPSEVTLTTAGASLPVGMYFGNHYDPNYNATGMVCSWTPSQIQEHYGLTAAYKRGLDGTGQTVVIIEGPADGTQLTSDFKQFSSLTGLPAPSASNFTILYPDGPPQASAIQSDNWQGEASLDTQWVHAIGPKANIVVEILPSAAWSELEYGIDYARRNRLGNVISNSYGLPEVLFSQQTVQGFDQVLEKAAAEGIAVNFSTGDSGDAGTGSPNGGGEAYPATSIYVTAVGGTSIGIPNGTKRGAEIGWGNNANILSTATNAMLDPGRSLGSFGGSGGGESLFFAKPFWEHSLPGTGRQEPDIAELADPYTGVVLVQSGAQFAGGGGTSLSCPIFSAIWAIANQRAGKSLGQAAPMLARLSEWAIHDIVPLGSPTNVTGVIVDSTGPTFYSSAELLPPLYTTTEYYSAFWDLQGEYLDLSFGTDTSLTVTRGWDNVTGWGVPNGLNFIEAAAMEDHLWRQR